MSNNNNRNFVFKWNEIMGLMAIEIQLDIDNPNLGSGQRMAYFVA